MIIEPSSEEVRSRPQKSKPNWRVEPRRPPIIKVSHSRRDREARADQVRGWVIASRGMRIRLVRKKRYVRKVMVSK
ncbi:MAG: hypothetical protein UX78_C0009G0010 [Candidatus Amesbacteria bacterium GW2011_GWA2_47_11]|uniref:Uncharacterized protein n=2 Tax=Candidatus Amesiibacteriota TaxID=1752730 RepID=A0A0G1TQG0_9BACT|nr:MAG: hypothetical protein UX78_C0009G0010 [Candidatus Amesbacteria bacterium GW2011_GWA2_47_11]KKW00017.1 MAG: hypothetical protein UY33_C0017G0017 [Candidatus Amesbacteria bacterium GW2011_GWA1_48_9]